MEWSKFFSFLFFIFILVLLFWYWFFPYGSVDFFQQETYATYNFTGENSSSGMQFYDNMRYPNSKISYRINDCSENKKEEVENAFDKISNLTILQFYPKESDEEIFVTCDSKKEMEGDLIVAGEGGPVNITKTSNFNVISKGQVLILRESGCENPNIAIHEILHSLGFNHSQNRGNVMYPVSNCKQMVGDDIPKLINELYSYPSYADLSIENASASMKGKYLDLNVSVRNNGLKDSGNYALVIYADEKEIRKIEFEGLRVGYGSSISLGNILVLKLATNEISLEIKTEFNELNKNNKIKLVVKK